MKTTVIVTVLALLLAGTAFAGVELTAQALTEVKATNEAGDEVIELVTWRENDWSRSARQGRRARAEPAHRRAPAA